MLTKKVDDVIDQCQETLQKYGYEDNKILTVPVILLVFFNLLFSNSSILIFIR